METTKSIIAVNKEITKELADPAVGRALLATTFKGLNEVSMKQAIFEGVMRGFTFKDFLEKNVYAIPFKDGYSLVTSIDYARKIGARGNVSGKSKPTFEMEDGKIESCDVTIYKKGGDDRGYTATVYFDEYYKAGKNGYPSLWDTKPRTMIAKVAEMHALRMACPEQLSQVYTVEELEKEADDFDRTGITDDAIVISSGDEDGGVVIPETDSERKILILKELKRLMPDIDTADAKEVKSVVADLTQLEMGPKSYANIIYILSRK